jgi:hypothetical protein
VERGNGADRVKEVMYGRREKTKGKTFRKVRLRERMEVAKKKDRQEGELYSVVNGTVRAQLSLVEKPLLGGRHVSAPILGHHQVSKKMPYEETV